MFYILPTIHRTHHLPSSSKYSAIGWCWNPLVNQPYHNYTASRATHWKWTAWLSPITGPTTSKTFSSFALLKNPLTNPSPASCLSNWLQGRSHCETYPMSITLQPFLILVTWWPQIIGWLWAYFSQLLQLVNPEVIQTYLVNKYGGISLIFLILSASINLCSTLTLYFHCWGWSENESPALGLWKRANSVVPVNKYLVSILKLNQLLPVLLPSRYPSFQCVMWILRYKQANKQTNKKRWDVVVCSKH